MAFVTRPGGWAKWERIPTTSGVFMRRAVPAVLAVFVVAGCAAPSAPAVDPLPHRTYSAAPGAPDLPSVAAQAAAPVSAVEVGPLGDRDAPFPDTTAEDLVAAGRGAGLVDDGAVTDGGSCIGYPGCRDAAEVDGVMVVVFRSAELAQNWRDSTTAGAEAELLGGRRYWAFVDYRTLPPEERSAWRNVLRDVVP